MKLIIVLNLLIFNVLCHGLNQKSLPRMPCGLKNRYYMDGHSFLFLWKIMLNKDGITGCTDSGITSTYIIPKDSVWNITHPSLGDISLDSLYNRKDYMFDKIRMHMIRDSIFQHHHVKSNSTVLQIKGLEIYNVNDKYGHFKNWGYGKVTMNGVKISDETEIGNNSVLFLSNDFLFDQYELLTLAQEYIRNPNDHETVRKLNNILDYDVDEFGMHSTAMGTGNAPALLFFCLAFFKYLY